MKKLALSLALAAAFAAAALTTTRPAFAADGVSLSDGSTDTSGPTACGQGKTIECGSTVVYRCVKWVPQITIGSSGGGVTYVCGESITQTSKSYKD